MEKTECHILGIRFTLTLTLELLHVITISYIIIIKYSPLRIFSTTMYLMRMETKYTESEAYAIKIFHSISGEAVKTEF